MVILVFCEIPPQDFPCSFRAAQIQAMGLGRGAVQTGCNRSQQGLGDKVSFREDRGLIHSHKFLGTDRLLALAAFDRTREQRSQQEQLVRTLQDTVSLSELRHKGGLDSFLQVLDAQRNLYGGQLQLAQLRLQERVTVVQLYRALGGGWS